MGGEVGMWLAEMDDDGGGDDDDDDDETDERDAWDRSVADLCGNAAPLKLGSAKPKNVQKDI